MLIYVSGFSRRRLHFAVYILLAIFLLFVLHSTTSRTYVDVQRIRNLLSLAENKSFCSERSVRRGFNQHVLSVSAYESDDRIQLKTNLTWFYIEAFTRQAKQFYPSWIVRVYYYNLVSKSQADIDRLEQLYENVDFCPAEDLPVLGNVKNKLPGKIQRFLPASE